jgi:antitoxin ParD1/3/4
MDSRQMSSMNVSIPEAMRRWVEKVVTSENFGTTSEYVRSLIREDQKRRARAELDAKLLEALESGPATELTKSDWEQVRVQLRERLKKGA